VRHVGPYPALEDEMCDFGAAGLTSGRSPDRLDALVWVLHALMLSAEPRVRLLERAAAARGAEAEGDETVTRSETRAFPDLLLCHPGRSAAESRGPRHAPERWHGSRIAPPARPG
jgi:hypothetical protein